jgi:macrolide transport system ATP-binding/permease protein
MKLLEAENLTKTYRIGEIEIRALQGVSLSIEEGEFVALMGPSGSGKSTLMHLLGFLDSPDSGRLSLAGKDVSKLAEDEAAFLRNRLVGFVFQQFNLMSRSTALENVALPLLYSGNREKEEETAGHLLQRVGLGDRVGHRPNELSGGQQQRVAIARALVNKPLLILADEPTGNLDSNSGREIMGIFNELHEKGMTLVLVTHDENVGQQAERIIRMQDGKVVSDERKAKPRSASSGLGAVSFEKGRGPRYPVKEFQEHLRQALRMIQSNKMRSFLSMLGVLIGVACVITMLALGRGARESITEQLSRLGSNLLSVRPGSAKVRGISSDATATRFTFEDARAIKESVGSVKAVVPQVSGSAQMVNGDRNWTTRVTGVTAEYVALRNQEPIMGRSFTEEEDSSRQRVVLLGQTVMRELFGRENPVGQSVKINRINFQVIGVLPSQGSNSFRDQDDVVMMPLMTAMKRVLGKEYLDQIDVEITDADQIPVAEDEIKRLIIRRQRLPPERQDSFNVRNYADVQAALSSTTQTFSILLGSVAAISLVVGGIGIMNIMLVSVKERTREIGLRKAIGATPRNILEQFLVEAVTITFIGGGAGIALAVFVSWLISTIVQWRTAITLGSLLLAFGFSAFVGIIFGLWPAKQASELEPIQSLRYE